MPKPQKYNSDFEKLSLKVQKKIKALRIESGLSQEDLMEYEISLRTIQRIEQGKEAVNITLLTLHRLATAFGVKTKDLFDI